MIKREFNAVDLLKFTLALLVIMIHVKPNVHSGLLTAIFNPLMSISVPCFFILSSVFIFNKLANGGGGRSLLKYCKRLSILYLSWFIIDIWYIIFRKPYIHEGFPTGIIELIKDLIFATTFPGSWFISALVVSVCIVYLLEKYCGIILAIIITLIVSLYFKYIDLLPFSLYGVYDWYSQSFREEVNLSFPANMIWVSIGSIIGCHLHYILDRKQLFFLMATISSIVCYGLSLFSQASVISYFFATAVCLIAFTTDVKHFSFAKRLRNYSIIIFFFHFSIAGKMSLFCKYVGDSLFTNWLYYLMVVAVSIFFAGLILRLEKYRQFHFLKYLH